MRFCKIENGKVTNIISAEQAFIDTLVDTYVQSDSAFIGQEYDGINFVSPTVVVPTLDELKAEKIKELHTDYQASYDAYLAQYPQAEVSTFPTKQKEATSYTLDNTSPTPSIDAMVGGDAVLRVIMINAIMAKVTYLSGQEGLMIAKRDAIKACTTQSELDAIVI